MQIDLLADHADSIPTLARWFREEWPDASTHDPASQFARACNRDRIPIALVATENGQVIGTVSLLERSVASHPHLAPWVAALYVRPEARHRGVATRLLNAVTERAWQLGCTDLYIGVSAVRDYYEGLGWIFVDNGTVGDETVVVLRKPLGGSVAQTAPERRDRGTIGPER